MKFRPIVASLATVLTLSLGAVMPAWSQASTTRVDEVVLDMQQAFRKGDRKRLSALLPQTRGHMLEPWAAYWELKARLDEASPQDVQAFLSRWAGTYQEDRLRNDLLLLLGQRRDWAAFAAEHPAYRMGDDREVRCYALLLDHLSQGDTAPPTLADEVKKNWYAQREADDGCTLAADRLLAARRLQPLDIWRKARLATEANRPRAVRAAVEIVAPQSVPAVADLMANPAKFLTAHSTAPGRARKELLVLALVRLANSDLDKAAQLLENKWGVHLNSEERHWAWGAIGRQAAMKLDPDALAHYAKVSQPSDLSDDALGWWVRAVLRSSSKLGRSQWQQVVQLVDAMSADAQRDPTWVYWKATALNQLQPQGPGLMLLETIAGQKGFYEMLAQEDLGRRVQVPPRPTPLTPAEKQAASQNAGLQRALHAIRIGLRPEGVREWNYSTNLVNGQGQPGGMNDRELLAAAQLACDREVWDRCINTSDRTRSEVDLEQRYPMPFRDAVLKRSREINLDPAYVYGLIRQESRFIMDARSHVGASGLMQVMPATARWTAKKIGLTGFTPDQITDRDTNIAIGTGYLKLVLDDFDGSMPLAAAAYNAGPGRPRQWRAPGGTGPVLDAAIWAENVPFNETRDYVKKVLANTTVYAALISGQPQSLRARLGTVGPRDPRQASENKDLP